jgi:uncharacterized membrane protein
LGAYFGLLGLLLHRYAWLASARHWPTSMALALLLLPLLFPLRGLLHGRPYTHAWTTFLALLYFVYGVFEYAGGGPGRLYGGAAMGLSLGLFAAAMLYARWRSQEGHDQSLPRTAQDREKPPSG